MEVTRSEIIDGEFGLVRNSLYIASQSSPKVNGVLELCANPHVLKSTRTLAASRRPSIDGSMPFSYDHHSYNSNDFPCAGSTQSFKLKLAQDSVETRARARFDGKVRKGRTQMGISLIKFAQTRDMIGGKVEQLKDALGPSVAKIQRDKKFRNYLAGLQRRGKLTANEVLEYQFGWKNLYETLRAGCTTVLSDAVVDDQYLSAGASQYVQSTYKSDGPYTRYQLFEIGSVRCKVTGRVRVVNPNVYLLDRLGVLNAPLVAWDLVPWSWVVNMFVNTNQIIGSITDDIGLDWQDLSYLTSYRGISISESSTTQAAWPSLRGAEAIQRTKWVSKKRTIGSKPPISLQVKAPELDFTTVSIAASVVLQRMRLISWAVRSEKSPRPMNWREVFPPGYEHL